MNFLHLKYLIEVENMNLFLKQHSISILINHVYLKLLKK